MCALTPLHRKGKRKVEIRGPSIWWSCRPERKICKRFSDQKGKKLKKFLVMEPGSGVMIILQCWQLGYRCDGKEVRPVMVEGLSPIKLKTKNKSWTADTAHLDWYCLDVHNNWQSSHCTISKSCLIKTGILLFTSWLHILKMMIVLQVWGCGLADKIETDLAQSHTNESTKHFSKDKKCDSHTCCGSCHSSWHLCDR